MSTRSIYQDIPIRNIRKVSAGMLPPASRFYEEIWDFNSVSVELRNLFKQKGDNIMKNASIRVMVKIKHGLFDELEEPEYAVERHN